MSNETSNKSVKIEDRRSQELYLSEASRINDTEILFSVCVVSSEK